MPLRDHFHPPLSEQRTWSGLHSYWASKLAEWINERLPVGYYAEPETQFAIEIDVATFDARRNGSPVSAGAILPDWPAAPLLTIPRLSTLTDAVEVRVFAQGGQRPLVGAIELVSPANKDREERQNAFLNKCLNLLRGGVGLMLVDIVTERQFNLHLALLERWGGPQEPFAANLYATAYRPLLDEETRPLAVWAEGLVIRQPLPTLPLWVAGLGPVAIDLEATYEQALRGLRYPPE